MKKNDINCLNENMIEAIGKEWMLITAGNRQKFNTMTASWGALGFIWGKPHAFIFVRPERYTLEFLNDNEGFTLAFLGKDNKQIHSVCGTKSGRDTDKVKETGLVPVETERGNITFGQARLTLECRKVYCEQMKAECFAGNDELEKWYNDQHGKKLHYMFVAEITNVWTKD